MSSTTPTIGLKKPEGSDPFLTEDFAANYDKIDAAFAARPAGGGAGGGDAATLGGSPKSFFYGPHNPPPATGVGSHSHTDYALTGHTHSGGTGGDATTLNGQPGSYYYSPSNPPPGGGGSTYTLPSDVLKSPGRSNPKMSFSSVQANFNGVNGVVVVIDYSAVGFTQPPSIALGVEVGSNWDMVANLRVNTRGSQQCEVRVARVSGALTTNDSGSIPRLHFVAGGI